jgi:hypothetical protein
VRGWFRRRVAWDDVPERGIVLGWRDYIDPYRPALAGITAAGIADASSRLEQFGRGLPLPPQIPAEAGPFPGELYRDIGGSALDIGLALALCDAGWSVSAPPGEPIVLQHGELRIKPIGTAEAVAKGDLTPEEWSLICEVASIADLPLGGKPLAAASELASTG